MYSLLPKTEQKTLRGEYRSRLAVVFLAFLFATLTLGSAFLYPAYYLSGVKEKEVTEVLETVRSEQRSSSGDLSATIRATKEELALVKSEDGDLEVSAFFDRIVMHAKNSGVRLESLSLDRRDGKASLRLSGIASTRDALLSFKKRLEAEKVFETVELPVSNLARATDIGFSMTITGKF